MPEPELYAVAARFKRALVAREETAAREIRGYYREAERRIRKRLSALIEELEQFEREHPGEPPPTYWLFERDRLRTLQAEIERELRRFATRATTRIEREQRRLVTQAEADARALTRLGMGKPPVGLKVTWTRLPTDAIEQMVGTLQDGSPLRDLLDALGPAASESIRRELVVGLALGHNPLDVARRCRDALNGNRVRAETIARTEMLRAYREATRESYLANKDKVKGWIWYAALDLRTCVACWAMHGTKHTLEEHLDDHPRGRCTMVPDTKSWAELGFQGMPERREPESGESLFAKLPWERQQAVLGPAAYRAYKAGAVKLSDFVGQKSDPRWGTMRYTRSLSDILGPEEARKWRSAPVPAPPPPPAPAAPPPVTVTVAPASPPPLPASPPRAPVSSALDLSGFPGEKTKLGAAVRRAIKLAEAVHELPANPVRIPVQKSYGKYLAGSYKYWTLSGKPVLIEVSQNSRHVELTLLHEFGHFLDHQFLGTPGRHASATAAALSEWRQAIDNSAAIKDLVAKLYAPPQPGQYVSKKMLVYYLQSTEIFARSYAQYIAEKTGDPVLLKQIEDTRLANPTYSSIQWDRADFAPIRQALDNLFRSLRWLK